MGTLTNPTHSLGCGFADLCHRKELQDTSVQGIRKVCCADFKRCTDKIEWGPEERDALWWGLEFSRGLGVSS